MQAREPRFDPVRDAKYLLSAVEGYQRNYANPISRLYSNVIDNQVQIQAILDEIYKSDKPESQKHAAAELFKLHHALNAEYIKMAEQYKILLTTLRDSKLSAEYTSLIFGMYCNKDWIRHTSQKNLLAMKLFTEHSSPEWRVTMAEVQKICFDKLMTEVNALDNRVDKLALLQRALSHMHAFFWKEKSALSNDATGTESYRQQIQIKLDAITLDQENKSRPIA